MKKLLSITVIFLLLTSSIIVKAKPDSKWIYGNITDSSTEKKVDYLERIYFSGENKDGLNAHIFIALQELEGKEPTPALARQVTFLLEIKDKALAAGNSCDVLDLLAVGIYSIDAAEAQLQGVKPPSNKAKESAGDAISSLNKLSTVSQGMGSTASSLAWSTYLLSGKTGSFGAANKIAGVGSTLGAAASMASQVGEIGKLFKKKDKPCNDAPKKTIEMGQHAAAAANANSTSTAKNNATSGNMVTTEISITGVSSSGLRVLADSLSNRPNVRESEKSYSQASSSITVVHTGSTDSIVDWITDNFSKKFTVKNYSKGKIVLLTKK